MQGVETNNLRIIFSALSFAAEKHRRQRRKSVDDTPYVNHVIEVADILCRVGGVSDPEILASAILHDTVEDTDTTLAEIEKLFGTTVKLLVEECTDDKALPKALRKQLQITNAPHKSAAAKQIKIADKISNINTLNKAPPKGWSFERRQQYLEWTVQVVAGLHGVNSNLDKLYNQVLAEGRQKLAREMHQM